MPSGAVSSGGASATGAFLAGELSSLRRAMGGGSDDLFFVEVLPRVVRDYAIKFGFCRNELGGLELADSIRKNDVANVRTLLLHGADPDFLCPARICPPVFRNFRAASASQIRLRQNEIVPRSLAIDATSKF